MKETQIPKRLYRDEIRFSIIGLGGMLLVNMEQAKVDGIIAEALNKGVNYFDVAPFYGDGEAEQKMGIALSSHRNGVFLACKTLERSAKGAMEELEQSLRNLRTDHFDLYQFHSLSDLDEVEEIFAPSGAMETFRKAKKQGKIRYIGFSAHSVEAALAMLDRFRFDSILFPVNFINYARGNFGPQVMAKAKSMGVARLAIKAMAHGPWKRSETRRYPNCWYRPIDDPGLAKLALRFTLSEGVTAAVPPGDERLFRMALGFANELAPLGAEEREALLASAKGLRPLMKE
jgi:aryl-alcohol dehydrogenase-like predicted oxidoreductase